MRATLLPWSVAALCLAAGAAPAADPVDVEVDALRVVRDKSLPSFNLTVTVHNTGPEDQELYVKEVRLKDTRDRVMQRIAVAARVPGLGRDWETLQPLLDLTHDEISLRLAAREAERLLAHAAATEVEVSVPFETRAFVGAFAPGRKAEGVVEVDYEYGGQAGSVTQDLAVDVEDLLLPLPPPAGAPPGRFILGDTHVHSTYSNCDSDKGRYPITQGAFNPHDQPDDLRSLYQDVGLQWINVSDHCYCVSKGAFEDEATLADAESSSSFLIIPGLEMSAREKVPDSTGQCVANGHDTTHLNGIGLRPTDALFAYTYDDGNRYACDARHVGRKAQLPFIQPAVLLLESLDNSRRGAVSLNHPGGTGLSGVAEPFNLTDAAFACMDAPPETGLEVINSLWDVPQDGESVGHWIHQRLLRGHHVAAYGGSDTHRKKKTIGATFTGVLAESLDANAARSVEDGLRRGRTFASTGPLVALWARPIASPTWTEMGDTRTVSAASPVQVHVAYSTGSRLVTVCLWLGRVGAQELQVPGSCRVQVSGNDGYDVTLPALLPGESYVRAEAIGWFDFDGELLLDGTYRAFASPVWLEVR